MPKFFYKINRLFVYSYSLFIIIFLAFSIYFYFSEKKNENLKNREHLQTLAKVKSNEITGWYHERFSDAAFLFKNALLKQELSEFSNSHPKPDSIKIVNLFEQIYKNHDYKNIFVINKNNKSIIDLNPTSDKDYSKDSLISAINKGKITFSNFYKNSYDSVVDLDVYVPIFNESSLISTIILKIDPDKLIFPLIQNWYVPNSSAESFIVFRKGKNVIFINQLKFIDAPPLTFKLPVNSEDLPAALAVKGIQGIVEGKDYRGEKVLADIRKIINTPWYLITKQDLSEIYLPVTNRLSFILLLLFSISAIGGISFLYFESKQNYKHTLEMNESIKKFELLYQTSNDAILIIENTKIINCNVKSVEVFKTEKNNILNKTLLDFSPSLQNNGASSKSILIKVFDVVAKGKPESFEWIFKKGEEESFCEINLSPLFIDDKHYFVAVIRDITEEKRIEDQNLRLLYAVEQSPASIVITNYDGKIEYVNPKFSKLTGYSFEEAVGQNPRILKSGELTQEVYKNLWQTITSGHEWRGEFHNKKKNGELYWEMASISPVKNSFGKITHFIAIKEDITETKQTHESLKKMAVELTQQNKYLEQFAYIISHNLRSPVANIIGIANTLKEADITEEEQAIMMEGLSFSVKKLDEVILDLNNILHIKKEVNEAKEKVAFSKLLDDIKLSISNLIEKENVNIKHDFSEVDEIFTLKSYMRSIFYNLISNSIKYRQPQISPAIEIKSKRINGKIKLIFKDNGLGIDLNENGDQVFGLYKRFHNHQEGKGLGLFMTKMQVETLNGKISISSEINKGTEFKIELEDKG